MPIYTWKHKALGTIVDCVRPMELHHLPPDDTGNWERVYSFGVGRVEGGGSSPARTSTRSK